MKPSPPLAGPVNPTAPTAVRLKVRGLGNVPAKKNSMYSVVNPRHREWQRQCIESLRSQLRSIIQTAESETLTGPHQPCSIVLLQQCADFDDNWRVIPDLHVRALAVPSDEAGAEIEITLI